MIRVETDAHSGFCGGVIRAISTAEKFLSAGSGMLWSLGAIVHNEAELARLAGEGLGLVEHDGLEGLSEGDTVLIRAHGEPPQTYETLAAKGLKVIDCTCPVVLKLQARIREASLRSQVLIFGKVGHPEVLGLVGQTGGRALVVESPEQLEALVGSGRIDTAAPVELFSQTTMSPEAYGALEARLRELVSGPLTVHNSICAQVASRHREIAAFASSHDVIIFVSGRSSSNGKVLYQWCRAVNPRSHHIGSPEELRPEWFEGAASAGVCGATSTPRWLLEQVASAISRF
ncbi:MAG: 4-hydroxy-3-methylbut-2-enyl diphosphate reductase [Bacteroidales bacterium]|nr:4-hydroxy-3-methylbut-2-enyl diphosphate reductase [Bacteroidales bacterium]